MILLLAAGFHLYRRQLVEAAVFGAAGAVLIVDDLHPIRAHRVGWARPTATMSVAGAGVVGAAMGLSPRYSGLDIVAVASAGITVMALTWPGGAGPTGQPARTLPRRTVAAWSSAAVVTCLVELSAYGLGDARHRGNSLPTLSDLIDPALGHWFWRVLAGGVWVATGVTLVRWSLTQAPAAEESRRPELPP
ncbi:hypothetical protein [Nakamurella panacisegetis]|uniref:hypothetical protein n=1 Tax=Nakamurella panacisegetis TaxID=1090615 RepID=UPI0012FE04D5|nr:hypothetical protein [Nakamurella panacisegetis]